MKNKIKIGDARFIADAEIVSDPATRRAYPWDDKPEWA